MTTAPAPTRLSDPAPVIAPPARQYRGRFTDPDRWASWTPRRGDILVTTPAKCGTTWTQTILAMLVNGGPDLPDPVPILSPWIDADLGVPADEVAEALDAQTMRRVIKTHTPGDGFPIWDGVTVVAVYRHPVDVFFSLRKHTENMRKKVEDDPMEWPVEESFGAFLDGDAGPDAVDRKSLAGIVMHYTGTARGGRLPDLKLFHYADMIRDGRGAVAALAEAVGVDADAALIDRIAEATAFGAMKAAAENYAPVAGTGFWKSDNAFFDSAGVGKWAGQLSDDALARYDRRLADLVPEPQARAWLEHGTGG